jgi:hypothetical protein
MSEIRKVVSVSNNTDIGKGWRVRGFMYEVRNWNSLGRTFAEERFRTESAARKFAAKLAAESGAEIQG